MPVIEDVAVIAAFCVALSVCVGGVTVTPAAPTVMLIVDVAEPLVAPVAVMV
jgi:hypothetical protein